MQSHFICSPGHHPSRRGCGVIEVLVALVVFTIGALALTASTAVSLHRLQLVHARAIAANAVASRVALIGAARCEAGSGGSISHAAGVTESWSVAPGSGSVLAARITMEFATTARTEVIETAVPCR